jgi:hypothetical protein
MEESFKVSEPERSRDHRCSDKTMVYDKILNTPGFLPSRLSKI